MSRRQRPRCCARRVPGAGTVPAIGTLRTHVRDPVSALYLWELPGREQALRVPTAPQSQHTNNEADRHNREQVAAGCLRQWRLQTF